MMENQLELQQALLKLFKLPGNTIEFYVHCVVNEATTVQCSYYPSTTSDDIEGFKYELEIKK